MRIRVFCRGRRQSTPASDYAYPATFWTRLTLGDGHLVHRVGDDVPRAIFGNDIRAREEKAEGPVGVDGRDFNRIGVAGPDHLIPRNGPDLVGADIRGRSD